MRSHGDLNELGIVIPTLNAAATLHATLDSVKQAMAYGASAIVVDGGSHDETLGIAEAAGISTMTHPGTMYAAINAGITSLATPWLTWINADDILYADALAARLGDANQADVVYGAVDFIDSSGRFVHCWRSARSQDLLTLYRSGYSPLLQQGVVFRHHVWDRIGGFDEAMRFVGDADFWWRAIEDGHRFLRHRGPPAAAFRLHPNQLSQRHVAEMREEHVKMAGGRPRAGCVGAMAALTRYRLENLSSYVIRMFRRPLLDGRFILAGSYDCPRNPSRSVLPRNPQ